MVSVVTQEDEYFLSYMRSHKYPLGGSVVQFFGVGRGLALSAAMQEEETLVETLFELSDE